MAVSDFCNPVKQFFKLNSFLGGPLKVCVASRNGFQQIRQHRIRVVRSSSNQEVVQAVDDASPVKVVRRHHVIQRPHGAFEHSRVFLTLTLPLPFVNATPKRFFKDHLHLPSTAVGHQQLDVLAIVKEVAKCEKLEGKNGLSKIPGGNVGDVAQHALCRLEFFGVSDAFQALLDHDSRQRRHANVLCSASQRLNDARRRVGGEDESSAAAALFHHSSQVRLARMTQVVGVFNDDDSRHCGKTSRRRSGGFLAGGWW